MGDRERALHLLAKHRAKEIVGVVGRNGTISIRALATSLESVPWGAMGDSPRG
jgi:hypothetical protein